MGESVRGGNSLHQQLRRSLKAEWLFHHRLNQILLSLQQAIFMTHNHVRTSETHIKGNVRLWQAESNIVWHFIPGLVQECSKILKPTFPHNTTRYLHFIRPSKTDKYLVPCLLNSTHPVFNLTVTKHWLGSYYRNL